MFDHGSAQMDQPSYHSHKTCSKGARFVVVKNIYKEELKGR